MGSGGDLGFCFGALLVASSEKFLLVDAFAGSVFVRLKRRAAVGLYIRSL